MEHKKIFLSSVIVALLMLVSLQVIFTNVVISDPSKHTGDADIGDLWISELDISSEGISIDNVSIAHVNATDDWVFWENRSGTFKADWDIDIGNNHPEYHVIFSMVIFDTNSNNIEVGNNSYETTLSANTSYDTSGTLSKIINFSYVLENESTRALVCYLGAYVKINDSTTKNAYNFTSMASDRCVVAVDFENPREVPGFSTYKDEANDGFPHYWAWSPGWDESSRFTNEDDMLNSQTSFAIGGQSSSTQQSNEIWYLGNLTVYIPVDWWRLEKTGFTPHEQTIEWSSDGTYINGTAIANFTIENPNDAVIPVKFVLVLKAADSIFSVHVIGRGFTRWRPSDPASGDVEADLRARTSYDADGDGNITVKGYYFGFTVLPCSPVLFGLYNYKIHINNSANQTCIDGDNYYWQNSVCYLNDTSSSFTVSSTSQSGITTVEVDISNILKSDNEYVETFSADRGDMRVKFKV